MTAPSSRVTLALSLIFVTMLAACGPTHMVLPSGHGVPVNEFQLPFEQASAACHAVRTIRTSIHLSGRTGGQRLRGTLIAGFERPDAMRLEGVAPFGPPVFILAAHDGSATLLLPRDDRVLTGVSAADMLDALAGVRLDPATLRAILAGCVVPDAQPSAAFAYETNGPIKIGYGTTGYPRKGWLAIETDAGTTLYLRQEQGQWRIVAGRLPGLEVQYDQFEGGLPRQIAILSRTDQGAAVPVDLSLELSDVGTNVTLNPSAFSVDVPAGAAKLTLAQLRAEGPLGVRR